MRRQRQQGMVLLAVLVVLVVTLLAGMGVMRAVQTGNAQAGNLQFRQAGLAASDRALTDAIGDMVKASSTVLAELPRKP